MGEDDTTVTNAVSASPDMPLRAGKYRIVGHIGHGGMGVVYRAVDDDLGRTVALKFLPPGLADKPAAESRFLREARAASALDHINIGTIFGVEETDDHRRFIVMAYYEAQNLAERVRDTTSPLNLDQTLSIAIQVGRGLAEAHSRGIIHRDIKPSNILITTQGIVKIVDFGLASMSDSKQLTSTGSRIGTPAYMSPEQALAQPVDHRTDIWSMAAVILELITGRQAFEGDSVPAVLYQIVHGRAAGLERQDLPLRPVLVKALEREPGNRYQSAVEFTAALESIASSTITAGPDSGTETHSAAPSKRRPPGFGWSRRRSVALAIVVISALLATAGVLWRDHLLRVPARPNAEASPAANASDKYLRSLDLIKRWDKEGNLELAIALLTEATKQDPAFALGYARLAEAQRIRYALTRERVWLDAAVKNANEAARLNSDLAPVQISLGRVYAMQGNTELAFASFERALKIDSNDAEAHQAIARHYEKLGRLEDAESSYRRAVSLDPESVSIHDSYANFLFRQSRHSEAIEEWRRVIRLAPDNAAAFVNLGSALSESGNIADAIIIFQRAVELKPGYMAYSNLGTAYSRLNRYTEAADAYRKALDIDDKDPMVWGNLAFVYSWMYGLDDRTVSTFGRAIELAEAKRHQSPRDAYVHSDLALYYAKTGKVRLALERLNTAVALAPKGADTQAAAAEVYELVGRRTEAIEFARKAIDLGYSRQRLEQNPELSKLLASLK
jgi:serine/threonine-protein kinase